MIKTKLHIFHFILKLNLRRFKTEENSYNLTKKKESLIEFYINLYTVVRIHLKLQKLHGTNNKYNTKKNQFQILKQCLTLILLCTDQFISSCTLLARQLSSVYSRLNPAPASPAHPGIGILTLNSA